MGRMFSSSGSINNSGIFIAIATILISIVSCNQRSPKSINYCREQVDTIGFANRQENMDSVISRIDRGFRDRIMDIYIKKGVSQETAWKAVICPHDDYTYANYLYPLSLEHVKASNVILFGVAHKASHFNLADKLIFGTFDCWNSASGKVSISGLQEELLENLTPEIFVVHDSMQIIEHSLEALVPFLQHYNPSVEIVPILVPSMSNDRMLEIAEDFSRSLNTIAKERKLIWGEDYAIVISNDAVHYGDEEWGGADYAFMGADSAGYYRAVEHEIEIIENCLTGEITPEKIRLFTGYTLDPEDHRKYRWTWCGRYSVPMGLLVCHDLARIQGTELSGKLLAYSTSITGENPDFSDVGMGVTAIATIRHWVGYAAIGY